MWPRQNHAATPAFPRNEMFRRAHMYTCIHTHTHVRVSHTHSNSMGRLHISWVGRNHVLTKFVAMNILLGRSSRLMDSHSPPGSAPETWPDAKDYPRWTEAARGGTVYGLHQTAQGHHLKQHTALGSISAFLEPLRVRSYASGS
jgi:hypothetical protein